MKIRFPKVVRDFIRSKPQQVEQWYESSDCCGADRWNDTDICGECKEHAEFIQILEQ